MYIQCSRLTRSLRYGISLSSGDDAPNIRGWRIGSSVSSRRHMFVSATDPMPLQPGISNARYADPWQRWRDFC